MSSIGYGQWKDYFEGRKPEEEVVKEWEEEEKKYTGRQMVWFKKDKKIVWFDISDPDYPENVDKLIGKWHNNLNVQKN
jgi:tRNA dimethylallyltransferase